MSIEILFIICFSIALFVTFHPNIKFTAGYTWHDWDLLPSISIGMDKKDTHPYYLYISFLCFAANLSIGKDGPLKDEEQELISKSEPETLAKWYLTLNHWKWPDELLPAEPDKYIAGGRRSQLMDLIEKKVGTRFILRIHNHQMTDDEFNDWWENHSIRNPKNKHYLG